MPGEKDRPAPRHRIFVNYRRDDSGAAAEYLADDLRRRFGDVVFFDQRAIAPGATWPDDIHAALRECAVVVACIGSEWHLAFDPETGANRLDDERDWVRRELELAGELEKTLLPVLVDGCTALPTKALRRPGRSLAHVADTQAIELGSGRDRDHGLEQLVAAIAAAGVRPLAAARGRAPGDRNLRLAYLEAVRTAHARLVPFFPELQGKLLADVFVQLELRTEAGEPSTAAREPHQLELRSGTLRDMLLPADRAAPQRLLVVGEPGAGKSTLVRHLAGELAGATGSELVPVFLALSRVRSADWDLFALAAESCATAPDAAAELAAWLRSEAGNGRAVILLDGLDEVDAALIGVVVARIEQLARDMPCAFAVTTRPIAIEDREIGRRWPRASVLRLDAPNRVRLAKLLLEPVDAAAFAQQLYDNEGLAALCGNPLMLTMAAMVAQRALVARQRLPQWRGELYDRAIDLLLHRGYATAAKPIREPGAARRLLADLSLRLHERGGEKWTRRELDEVVWQVRRADADLDFQLERTWGTCRDFLEDIGLNAGVLGPHDGEADGWRYLHRSLREYLAAEQLARKGVDALEARFTRWAADLQLNEAEQEEDKEKWAELHALVCGMTAEPLRLLVAIRGVSAELALRTLATVGRVDGRAALAFALETEGWDADEVATWIRQWRVPADAAAESLRRLVAPGTDVERLGQVWWLLEQVGRRPDREQFFAECERPVGGAPRLVAVEVPAGTFVMGSPAGEPERYDSEGPRHEVAIARFWLCATTVTSADYRRFEPEHSGDDEHPATEVSWWAAYLYCRWLGDDVRLPSEAEWEYACRAGKTTPFSFGVNINPVLVNYDGNFPYDGGAKGEYRERTVPVGSLPANPWGLHEMHGNVWEWCQDRWHDSYRGAPANGSAWEEESGSGDRVLRGASWFSSAGYCRSASRGAEQAFAQNDYVGFRPASSSPDSFTTSPPEPRVQTQARPPKPRSATKKAARARKKTT